MQLFPLNIIAQKSDPSQLLEQAIQLFSDRNAAEGFLQLEAAASLSQEQNNTALYLQIKKEQLLQTAYTGSLDASFEIIDECATYLAVLGDSSLIEWSQLLEQAAAIATISSNEQNLRVGSRALNNEFARNGSESSLYARIIDHVVPAYYHAEKLDSAILLTEIAIEIMDKLPAGKYSLRSDLFNKKGFFLYAKGDVVQSIDFHKMAIEVLLDSLPGSHPFLATNYNQIAFSYYKLTDFTQARFYHNLAIEVVSNTTQQFNHQMASAYKGLGFIDFSRGNFAESLVNIRKSKSSYLAVFNNSTNNFLRELYVVSGRCHDGLGNFDSAYFYFDKALTINDRAFLSDSLMIQSHIATALIDEGKYEEALSICNLISGYFDKSNSYQYVMHSYQNAIRAKVYTKMGRFNDAEETIEGAYEMLQYVPGSKDFSNILNYAEVLAVLRIQIKLVLANHRLPEQERYLKALDLLDEVAVLIQHARTFANRDINDYEIVSRNSEFFYDLVSINDRMFKLTGDSLYVRNAFLSSERYRANILLEIARELEAKEVAGIPSEKIEDERQLRISIGSLTEKLKQQPNNLTKGERASIGSQIRALKDQHSRLIDELEKSYPDYYQIKYAVETNTVADIQQMLVGKDKALLEFFVSDTALWLFTITESGFYCTSKKITAAFDDKLTAYLNVLHEGAQENLSDFESFSELSHYLYTFLLEPIADQISGLDLIILPDAKLYYLPFETLLTREASTEDNFLTAEYLLKQNAISYYYSATLLDQSRSRENKATSSYLGMSPVFDPVGDTTLPLALRTGLAPLDGAQKEVKTIAGFFGGKRLTGIQASEANFKKYGSNYNILHLATHAISNSERPLDAYLIFAQNESGTEDGHLHLYELYNMHLNAELAALSACYTGYGEILKGEGVISFAHAFSYANCPNIIMSLWAAEDESTASIVSDSFRELKAGLAKDKALQKAKLDYLKKADPLRAHPFFWSSMVLMGETSPIEFTGNGASINWQWIVAIACLLLIAVFVFFRRKKVIS